MNAILAESKPQTIPSGQPQPIITEDGRVLPPVILIPMPKRPTLIGLTQEQLQEVALSMGEPRFRADQLHHWLYVYNVRDWDKMTNLKKGFKDKLAEKYDIGCLTIDKKQVSADGTIKYLFRLHDGKLIESVLMYFEDRDTYAVCISSQVGCAMNCGFCATGKLGFTRHLSVQEIVEQYVYVQGDSGKEVRNIVFMGQGEPFANYDNLMQAVYILNRSAEVGMRHITISTSGVVPKIDRLAEEPCQVTLAISLHAPNDTLRHQIMPISKKWPLTSLMPALHRYVRKTGRRLTIEYILLNELNDKPEHAHELGKLISNLKCNVNLIPYNPINDGYGYSRPSRSRIFQFKTILDTYGKKVTVRLERGTDIDAACGQLANKALEAAPGV